MKLTYRYNNMAIEISEMKNENDVEFEIKVITEENWPKMKEVQRLFEEDKVITDVLFYTFENHRYRIIVRNDYYVAFILGLMKHRLIESVEWV